jgi:hypothetical protein
MLNFVFAITGALFGSTSRISLTVAPSAFGYCSVTYMGRFKAAAPRTCNPECA